MARSSGEVQADIALTRRVIEHELDALHRRVPARWWLSYAWLAGGLAVGVLLSRAPILAVLNQSMRVAQVVTTLLGTTAFIDRTVTRWDAGPNGHLSRSSRDSQRRAIRGEP